MTSILWLTCMALLTGAADSTLSASLVERGRVEMGDVARFQHVMAKARRGEAVVVGVIGGSITQGARASAPEKCWGALTADWWRTAFPQSAVTFVNAGIGATASDLGAHRVRAHLLDKKPDVVVVEYAVNDSGNPFVAETLEGLVRQILCEPQQPAVALFFTMDKAGNSRQPNHIPVGHHYGLPMVSLRDALWPEIEAGRLSWTDFEADEVHPNDLGHGYSAQLIGGLFDAIKATLPEDAALPAIAPLPEPMISNLFQDTRLLNAASLTPTLNNGWEPGSEDPFFGAGWKTSQPGSELSFVLEGRAISVLFWRIKGAMGQAEAWVDDGPRVLLEAWFDADWGGYTPFQLVARDLGPGQHTLHVKLLETRHAQSTGNAFELRAVMTAGK